tara:strand:- start:354 stop:1733 length:1380 start_codon:yes stop_codon:yes gene_type:complete
MKRRQFVTGLIAGAAALSVPPAFLRSVYAAQPSTSTPLSIVRRTIEVNGRAASVFGLQQADGSTGLRLRADELFKVRLRNETDEQTIIHWHGLTPPWPSDGVPDAPLPLINASMERIFEFPLETPGTHWMHAHTLQEQMLLAAPLIVEDPADDGRDEQEVVILLHDFSFTSPEELLAGLARPADAMAPMDHGGMAMDLNDIEYDAYLANDRTLDDPEVVNVELGGRIRVRIINGATATAFTIDLGAINGQLVAVDGQNIEPVGGRRFPISMGQRLDIRLELPSEGGPFPILALREGSAHRTGVILQPPGSQIAKMASQGTEDGPVLDLALEADLRAIAPLPIRVADKSFEMTLNGEMAKYQWSLGLQQPIMAVSGDRIEVTMTNMSMMAHPMHLHGHHFQVVAIDGKRIVGAVRDTVLIPPRRAVTIAVDASNPGQWAFHCHHLYHMATGMMSTFGYRT